MFRLISRVQVAYIGLFLIACVGVLAYEALYLWPMERCEADGGWWSMRYRMCATPIPIWRITGRLPGGTPGPRAAPAAPGRSSAGQAR